jgi:hypothetical protein
VMGGVFGAVDPFGRVTDRLGNAFGGWLDGQGFDLGFGPAASWDNWDPSTYGFGKASTPGANARTQAAMSPVMPQWATAPTANGRARTRIIRRESSDEQEGWKYPRT